MATLRDKIELLIEVQTARAQSALSKLRTDMAAAEGTTGKLRAGFSNLTSAITASPMALLAAGTALVAFGAKSVQAFQNTALAAGKFSDATGIAVEEGSRLLDVAGDIGIGGEQMTAAFAKLNRALGQGDLKQWGIDADNATDGFLQTVEALQRIEDPTKRALLAQQAFGRGYTQIAELTAMSADELREAIEGVSDAEAIDEDELRKAREYREAMTRLNDRMQQVYLTVGEQLVPVVEELATAFDALGEEAQFDTGSISALEGLVSGISGFLTGGQGGSMWQGFQKGIDLTNVEIETKLNPNIGRTESLLEDVGDAGDAALGDLEDGTDNWTDVLTGLQESLEDAADELDRLFDAVPQAFDAEQAFLELTIAVDDYRASLADSTMTAEERRLKEIQLAGEALKSAQAWATLNGATDKSAESAQLQIDMLRNLQGQYPEIADEIQVYIDALSRIPRNVATTVTINGRPVGVAASGGGTTVGLLPAPRPGTIASFDAGGTVPGPIGSEQLIMAHGGETVLPTHKSGYSSGGGLYVAPGAIVINGPADGEDIVRKLREYSRRSGWGWIG